jgi:hypothetical protein
MPLCLKSFLKGKNFVFSPLICAALAAAVDPFATVHAAFGLLRRHALAVAFHAAAPASVEITHAALTTSGFAERQALAVAFRAAFSAGKRTGAHVFAFSGVKTRCGGHDESECKSEHKNFFHTILLFMN